MSPYCTLARRCDERVSIQIPVVETAERSRLTNQQGQGCVRRDADVQYFTFEHSPLDSVEKDLVLALQLVTRGVGVGYGHHCNDRSEGWGCSELHGDGIFPSCFARGWSRV